MINLHTIYTKSNINALASRLQKRLLHMARATLVLLLALGLNITGFGFLAETAMAYYGDHEVSNGNSFTAAALDFGITNNEREGYIGLEADGDIDDFNSVVQPKAGSLDIQYKVEAELAASSNAEFCDSLDFKVIHTGTDFSDGKNSDPNFGFNTDHSILDVNRATTTDMGTYEFKDIDLSNEASQFPHGAECNVDLVFTGWRDGVDTPEESGYTDEERISLRLKNRMVVMNEFLPNPDDKAHGLDYGSDSSDKPNGEWIELYNNSEIPHDVGGWSFKDEADNEVIISAANTDSSSTVVPANGWLVVYLEQAFLNNTGDTFRLKDTDHKVVDEYTYDGSDYCEQEPSPNATNTMAVDGDCDSVPPNKSYARIPDGIGAWVDPIPTPGAENSLDQPTEMMKLVSEEEKENVAKASSTAFTTATTSESETASSTESAGEAEDKETSSSSSSSSDSNPDESATSSDGSVAGTSTATTTQSTATSTATTSDDEITDTASSSDKEIDESNNNEKVGDEDTGTSSQKNISPDTKEKDDSFTSAEKSPGGDGLSGDSVNNGEKENVKKREDEKEGDQDGEKEEVANSQQLEDKDTEEEGASAATDAADEEVDNDTQKVPEDDEVKDGDSDETVDDTDTTDPVEADTADKNNENTENE